MCRSQADGGRRCPGHHTAPSPTPPEPRESHYGTKWQGYDEYQQRAAELDRRIAAGESITDIMRAEQLRRGQERIAQIQREGW